MVAIYGQTDKLILKQMMDETVIGYVTIYSMCTFVLAAIIDAMYPTMFFKK